MMGEIVTRNMQSKAIANKNAIVASCWTYFTTYSKWLEQEDSGWLGHLCRMQELDPQRKLTVLKIEGTRRVGKPKLRWLESVEKNLKEMGMRNWRRQQQDREQQKVILVEAKVHQGL